jgi:hypothetical protein
MSDKKTVNLDGVEHDIDTFTDQQKVLLDHFLDLDQKVSMAQFQIQQIQVAKDSFLSMLKTSLAEQPTEVSA